MGLSAWEQKALNSIEDELAGSEPKLAALLGTFTKLASDEEMPPRDKVRASSMRAIRRSRSKRLSLLCILLWLLVTAALIGTALAFSHGGHQTACPDTWAVSCTSPAPASSSARTSSEVTLTHVPG